MVRAAVVIVAVVRLLSVALSGARTQLSGALSALVVAPLLVFGTVTFEDIPIAVLAAIVIVAVAPFIKVGTLSIAQRDLTSLTGQAEETRGDKFLWNPWHAPEEFRPLGALMRARSAAYRESVQERGAAAEPDGTEEWGG